MDWPLPRKRTPRQIAAYLGARDVANMTKRNINDIQRFINGEHNPVLEKQLEGDFYVICPHIR